jgi:hypothetical protein
MLRDLREQKRLALPDGDADLSYLRFLEHYRAALASPIGFSLFALVDYSPINGSGSLVLTVYYPLLLVLLLALPSIIFVFILPLRDIHATMVSEARTKENRYFTRTEALREQIQALLDCNQVEAAEAVQKRKALVEALYAPSPTWPFPVRSKISSTVLEVGWEPAHRLAYRSDMAVRIPCHLDTLLPHTLALASRTNRSVG